MKIKLDKIKESKTNIQYHCKSKNKSNEGSLEFKIIENKMARN